jgi:alanine dehydrogenase
LPYVLKLAAFGLGALREDSALAAGAATVHGRLVAEAVAQAQGLEYTPLEEALGVSG